MIAHGKEIWTPRTKHRIGPFYGAAGNGLFHTGTETAGIHIVLASAEALVPIAPCLSLTTAPAVPQQHGFQCKKKEGEEERFPG